MQGQGDSVAACMGFLLVLVLLYMSCYGPLSEIMHHNPCQSELFAVGDWLQKHATKCLAGLTKFLAKCSACSSACLAVLLGIASGTHLGRAVSLWC